MHIPLPVKQAAYQNRSSKIESVQAAERHSSFRVTALADLDMADGQRP